MNLIFYTFLSNCGDNTTAATVDDNCRYLPIIRDAAAKELNWSNRRVDRESEVSLKIVGPLWTGCVSLSGAWYAGHDQWKPSCPVTESLSVLVYDNKSKYRHVDSHLRAGWKCVLPKETGDRNLLKPAYSDQTQIALTYLYPHRKT